MRASTDSKSEGVILIPVSVGQGDIGFVFVTGYIHRR